MGGLDVSSGRRGLDEPVMARLWPIIEVTMVSLETLQHFYGAIWYMHVEA